ncbi:CGNR zinc finger domain-containing protein [Dactylosporangium cerinum]|uniref:CGNR zinc finger domain-containing protein n=1 Tax=Dactylosporangium cerinum TaxID=1434730 RepID=A0ABV9W9R9_9ACTN
MAPDPVAIAFANTRSSSHRDRIATLTQWRTWIDAWPGFRTAGNAVDADGLLALRETRDDVQLLLHSATGGGRPAPGPTARLLALARSASSLDLRWQHGRPTLAALPDAPPAWVIAQHLTRAALDLLLTGPPLMACQGQDCLKLFITSRPDRRWCDTAVCGNRARVRAYNDRRQHGHATNLNQDGSTQ